MSVGVCCSICNSILMFAKMWFSCGKNTNWEIQRLSETAEVKNWFKEIAYNSPTNFAFSFSDQGKTSKKLKRERLRTTFFNYKYAVGSKKFFEWIIYYEIKVWIHEDIWKLKINLIVLLWELAKIFYLYKLSETVIYFT